MKYASLWVGSAALLAMSTVVPSAAHAGTVNITQDNLSGVDCSAAPTCGTITFTDGPATTLNVSVTLNDSIWLHNDGQITNFTGIFGFSVSNEAAITSVVVNTPNNDANLSNGYRFSSDLTATQNYDGFGSFGNEITCASSVTGGICGQVLSFTVNASSAVSFVNGDGGFLFALDVAVNSTTNPLNPDHIGNTTTGFAATPGPIMGAGLPGLVMACGGLLGLARRRRRMRIEA